jgi:hypothetical protein
MNRLPCFSTCFTISLILFSTPAADTNLHQHKAHGKFYHSQLTQRDVGHSIALHGKDKDSSIHFVRSRDEHNWNSKAEFNSRFVEIFLESFNRFDLSICKSLHERVFQAEMQRYWATAALINVHFVDNQRIHHWQTHFWVRLPRLLYDVIYDPHQTRRILDSALFLLISWKNQVFVEIWRESFT